MITDVFIFEDLPKVSQNEALAMHWGKRKKIREMYEHLITHVARKKYNGKQLMVHLADVTYTFSFDDSALDCLNCCEMVKWIEDIIFKYDTPDYIRSVKMISKKNAGQKKKMIVTVSIEYEEGGF